ncbi:MAG: hypothetical protein GKR90_17660 [Pseudomonadales bacterium]|nr:hypothetical protein [Pseudomonadales bacterium]
MIGYEAVSGFNDLVANLNNLLFGYISILSAFLIMSYFAAGKLSNGLALIVIVLFSLACLMLIIQFNFMKTDMEHLFRHIIDLKAAGDPTVSWFGHNPGWAVGVLTIIQNLVTIGGYVGCLLFFFSNKKK